MKRCPFCRSRRLCCRNSYPTRRQGRCRKYRCRRCLRSWHRYERPFFGGAARGRTRLSESDLLKSAALLARGLPWTKVSQLLGIQVASLRARFRERRQTNPGREKFERKVQHKYRLAFETVTNLFEEFEGIDRGEVNPRDRAFEYFQRARELRYRRRLERQLQRIVGVGVEVRPDGRLRFRRGAKMPEGKP